MRVPYPKVQYSRGDENECGAVLEQNVYPVREDDALDQHQAEPRGVFLSRQAAILHPGSPARQLGVFGVIFWKM